MNRKDNIVDFAQFKIQREEEPTYLGVLPAEVGKMLRERMEVLNRQHEHIENLTMEWSKDYADFHQDLTNCLHSYDILPEYLVPGLGRTVIDVNGHVFYMEKKKGKE